MPVTPKRPTDKLGRPPVADTALSVTSTPRSHACPIPAGLRGEPPAGSQLRIHAYPQSRARDAGRASYCGFARAPGHPPPRTRPWPSCVACDSRRGRRGSAAAPEGTPCVTANARCGQGGRQAHGGLRALTATSRGRPDAERRRRWQRVFARSGVRSIEPAQDESRGTSRAARTRSPANLDKRNPSSKLGQKEPSPSSTPRAK